MINKSDRELELEKKLADLKEDLEDLIKINILAQEGNLFSGPKDRLLNETYKKAMKHNNEYLQEILNKNFPKKETKNEHSNFL